MAKSKYKELTKDDREALAKIVVRRPSGGATVNFEELLKFKPSLIKRNSMCVANLK